MYRVNEQYQAWRKEGEKKSGVLRLEGLLYVCTARFLCSRYGTAEGIPVTVPPRVLALGADRSGQLPAAPYQALGLRELSHYSSLYEMLAREHLIPEYHYQHGPPQTYPPQPL